MNLCVVSHKVCWQDGEGHWYSYGGFPLQMEALASLFDQTTILIIGGRVRAGGLALPRGARVVPLPAPFGVDWRRKLSVLARAPGYLITFTRHFREADVVHTPLPGDISLLALVLALLLRKRLIARYGGSWLLTEQSTLANRFTRALLRRSAGGRNVVVVTGDPDQIVEPGITTIFSTALSEEELRRIDGGLDRLLSSPPRAVYAGRLSPEKGLRVLFEALTFLKQKGLEPLPRVTLVGDGPQRAELESLASALSCAGLLLFVGQRDRASLSQELASADFCVQPSLTEGFSKAWLDAMAHGLPVLSSNVGAASSVLGREGERGWLVPAGDSAALARRIHQIVTEPLDWPALRRRCRAYVEGRTLKVWASAIGGVCARQWGLSLDEGRLRL